MNGEELLKKFFEKLGIDWDDEYEEEEEEEEEEYTLREPSIDVVYKAMEPLLNRMEEMVKLNEEDEWLDE